MQSESRFVLADIFVSCRRKDKESQLKAAQAFLKLGEVGLETGKLLSETLMVWVLSTKPLQK